MPGQRVAEADDSGEMLAAEDLGAASKEPRLAVAGHLVPQNEAPQLYGVGRGALEDVEDLVVGGVRVDGDANELPGGRGRSASARPDRSPSSGAAGRTPSPRCRRPGPRRRTHSGR